MNLRFVHPTDVLQQCLGSPLRVSRYYAFLANPTRRYPRVKSPKGLNVAWQSATLKLVSRVETPGLGGLLGTPMMNP